MERLFYFTIRKLTILLQKSNNKNESKNQDENPIDIEIQYASNYLKTKERDLKLFEKIVGDTPMKQIDWIISNGFEKYDYWYMCYEEGRIYQPATVEPFKENGTEIVVRGGLGNARISVHNNAAPLTTFGDFFEITERDKLIK